MRSRTTFATLPTFLAAALLATACSESVGPGNRSSTPGRGLATPSFATAATFSGIALDQLNSTLGPAGQLLIKGFNPTNPHRGDAIIATFYWTGSTNIIDSVVDVLTSNPYTPVGNKYTLVEYVTAGGYSMATYVATNVQNFPDPNVDPGQGDILAVGAYLSQPAIDGGVSLSAWTGVSAVAAHALGAHRSASGTGSGTNPFAGPGSISIGAGALAYAATMSGTMAGRDPPTGFTRLYAGADGVIVAEDVYAVQSAIGTVDPLWFWGFPDSPPSTWLATVIALNPPLHLAFTVQPSRTLPLLAIQPAVQVTALNAEGNRMTTYNGPVTIAIGRNAGVVMPGTLSGTLTVTAVNGVATFSNLSIDQLGSGYTLVVNAANVFGAESAPFNIGAF
jgi:hypothetical protein